MATGIISTPCAYALRETAHSEMIASTEVAAAPSTGD
jgi:hypothetical protein